MQDSATETADIAVATETDLLGPCEPGTSVTLEGIVWRESDNGMGIGFTPVLEQNLIYRVSPGSKFSVDKFTLLKLTSWVRGHACFTK